ncbi:MAG: TonB-dependent receptor [Bacteroidales bacterium]|nr:TonB-dependent receptor [Bacteroidales bacterium]
MAILLPGTLSPATAAPQPTLTVRGVVVDSDNVPVVGAYIVEKGTENGTMADSNGQFIINVKDGASLEVSCMGYVTQTVAAAANVRVVLSQDNLFLDETVVVGYGTKRVATITGSVAQVNSDKLNTAPVTNTTHTLAGQLPGLVSKQVSGLPGQDNASLNIRGFGSPLVIVDGVEGNIETLDPGQIESISILKDGSGSIYGARAGNGVILVTTKTGSNQKPTVTLNSSLTLQGNTVTTRPADSFQRALYQNDVYMNAGGVESRKPYLDEELELFKLGTNPEYMNTDWYDAVVRKYSPQQNHNLSVSGGTDKSKYYGYFGYNRQELQFKPNSGHYDKYNFQVNFSTKVSDRLNVGMNIQYMMNDKDYPSGGDLYQDGTNFWQGIIYSADPRYPLYLPDRTKFSYANMQNGSPIWAVNIDNSGYYRLQMNNVKFNGFAEYDIKPVEGLKAKANVIYIYNSSFLKWMHKRGSFYTYEPGADLYSFAGQSVEPSALREDHGMGTNIVQQYSLNYNRDFNGHNISALAMFESTLNHNKNFWTKVQNFQTTIIEEMVAGEAETATNGSGSSNYGRTSVIGRLDYNYRDRYMVEATVRGDASSRFARKYQWGWFPSISAGWNIARENFMSGAGWVDNLKLRASMGMSGYDSVADFNYLTGYSYDSPYTFGTETVMGLAPTGLANELLTWEKMTIYNVGVDWSFFGRKLYGELDVFQRNRDGIPGYRSASLPNTFGASLPQENLNSIRGRGFELRVGTAGTAGDFTYDMSANISWNRSKWTKYDQAEETDPDRARLYTVKGKWTDRQLGYKSDGLFEDQNAIDTWGVTVDDLNNDNSTYAPGDVRLVDTNDDGVINWKDQVEIGKGGTPHWMTGFNFAFGWKGFDLSMLFQGAWGYTLAVSYDSNTATYCDLYYDSVHNADPNAVVSRPNGAATNWWASDFMYRDVAYLRLKNASFGYSLPSSLLRNVGIQKCRLYVAGMNLFTLSTVSKYGVDPEAGRTVGYAYPQQYTMSVGLNIVF